MAKSQKHAPIAPTPRAEKMSILSAMLGPDAMARIRKTKTSEGAEDAPEKVALDPDRVAWHRNKLLERLREQGAAATPQNDTAQEPKPAEPPKASNPVPYQGLERKSSHLDARLSKIASAATLAQEHPAIIARLIKTLSRDERVEALKSLPGPLARSIVKRLR